MMALLKVIASPKGVFECAFIDGVVGVAGLKYEW